ncbi:hypothetical protein AAFF_G00256430 [Aldrovandia affinis]|uniref:Uncharacterized protein n=1 Tax=Aldrovandia affinis TaxID=143900 RepID=A0AAD7ST08_9TELE|nr:hypothetical protein AAFF_G00256430 [Aldrovandia affinis]
MPIIIIIIIIIILIIIIIVVVVSCEQLHLLPQTHTHPSWGARTAPVTPPSPRLIEGGGCLRSAAQPRCPCPGSSPPLQKNSASGPSRLLQALPSPLAIGDNNNNNNNNNNNISSSSSPADKARQIGRYDKRRREIKVASSATINLVRLSAWTSEALQKQRNQESERTARSETRAFPLRVWDRGEARGRRWQRGGLRAVGMTSP